MSSLLKKTGLTALFALTLNSASAITFNDFVDVSSLSLNGNAATEASVLRLTPASAGQVGSAFTKTALNAAKFSTYFKFLITKRGGRPKGADGFVFVIQANAPDALGSGGGDLGYRGILNSVAVEFDTYRNTQFHEPIGVHVAVDVGGDVVHSRAWPAVRIEPGFADGHIWSAWIDYDGGSLEVRLSPTNVRPALPQLKKTMNIPALLGHVNQAYVGFTAATGGSWENHDILAWEYREDYQPISALSGAAGSLQADEVVCENAATHQTVVIPEDKAASWDCRDAGLIGQPGDSAVITITGKLK